MIELNIFFIFSQNFPRIRGGEDTEQEKKTAWPYTLVSKQMFTHNLNDLHNGSLFPPWLWDWGSPGSIKLLYYPKVVFWSVAYGGAFYVYSAGKKQCHGKSTKWCIKICFVKIIKLYKIKIKIIKFAKISWYIINLKYI